jgi:hypothetical protein
MTDSRRKGKRTELQLCAILRPFFPDARRNMDQYQKSDGRDVLGTPGLCLQLKAGKAPSWRKALAEATGSAEPGEIPVGVTRQDREGFVVHIILDDFLQLRRWGEQ